MLINKILRLVKQYIRDGLYDNKMLHKQDVFWYLTNTNSLTDLRTKNNNLPKEVWLELIKALDLKKIFQKNLLDFNISRWKKGQIYMVKICFSNWRLVCFQFHFMPFLRFYLKVNIEITRWSLVSNFIIEKILISLQS